MGPADVIIGAAVAALTVLAVRRLIKDRRAGKTGCGGGCGGCPWSGSCSKPQKADNE